MKFLPSSTQRKSLTNDFEKSSTQSRAKRTLFLVACLFFVIFITGVGIFSILQLLLQIETMKEDIAENRRTTKNILEHFNLNQNLFSSQNFSYVLLSTRHKRQSDLSALIAAHLVGPTRRASDLSNEPLRCPGNYFKWTERNERSIDQMAVPVVQTEHGTFLQIQRSGYYFVYSQVTYFGFGQFPMGHKTVRLRQDSGQACEASFVLMEHLNTQRRGSSKHGATNRRNTIDSGYHGALFHFFVGDKIGVEPFTSDVRNQWFKIDKTKSFFGLFFVAE